MADAVSKDQEIMVDIREEVASYLDISQPQLRCVLERFAVRTAAIQRKNSQLTICGPQPLEYLKAAGQSLLTALESLACQRVKRSALFIKLLSAFKRDDITNKLVNENILVGWAVKEETLWICSNTEETVSEAVLFFDKLIGIKYFPSNSPLESSQLSLVKTQQFSRFAEHLQYQLKSFAISYNEDLKKIEYISTEEDKVFVCEVISTFFASNGGVTVCYLQSFLPIQYEVLMRNKAVVEKCTIDTNTKITIVKSACIITSSSNESFARAKTAFNKLLAEMMHQRIQVSKFSFRGWLKSTHSLSQLDDIDQLCRTVSTVTSSLATTAASHHPSVRRRSTKSLGWLFEHWPFLYQYESTYKKVMIKSDDIMQLEADGYIIFSSWGEFADLPAGLHSWLHPTTQQYLQVYKMPELLWNPEEDAHEALMNAVANALHATKYQTTIAISFYGLSLTSCHLAGAAESILGTILHFLSSNPTYRIDEISLVPDPKQTSLNQVLKATLRRINAGVEQVVKSGKETVIVDVAGVTQSDVTEATARYVSESETVAGSIDWSNSPFRNTIHYLQPNEVEEIKVIGENKGVAVEVDEKLGKLRLTGLFSSVQYAKEIINSHLLKVQSFSGSMMHWSLQANRYRAAVDSRTLEYLNVSRKFYQSLGTSLKCTVKSIIRVENKRLKIQHMAYRKRVEKEVASSDVVRKLWYGATPEVIDSIISEEFNRSYNSKENGVSFEETAERAVKSTESSEILLVQVVTGNTCVEPINTGSSQPPYYLQAQNMSWPNVNKHKCHSSVNSKSSIVIYHDAAAYPEYIIRFKRN